MVISTPGGIALVDLKTFRSRLLVKNPKADLMFAARRSREIFYSVSDPGEAQPMDRPRTVFAVDVDSGRERRVYRRVERNDWSVHFNSSPDGRLFAGDGGDSEMVAHATDGKWLVLLRPDADPESDRDELIQTMAASATRAASCVAFAANAERISELLQTIDPSLSGFRAIPIDENKRQLRSPAVQARSGGWRQCRAPPSVRAGPRWSVSPCSSGRCGG